ncbi:Hypothetical_protein [Hexamita inflata]|uniref:Hypothetical_protein n=1 Tax=Hexamita inflata TaxID=28002 RepID=A0AA86R8C6_9EUKA|nr:Hypothetical protein HINF_LOCUS61294 [Hexamita inflata]
MAEFRDQLLYQSVSTTTGCEQPLYPFSSQFRSKYEFGQIMKLRSAAPVITKLVITAVQTILKANLRIRGSIQILMLKALKRLKISFLKSVSKPSKCLGYRQDRFSDLILELTCVWLKL